MHRSNPNQFIHPSTHPLARPQAPLCLLLVGLVLYLFRSIYGECISSYPLNGGSYSLLLNTSSKAVAALGACLSVIAYVATGVVRPSRHGCCCGYGGGGLRASD